MNLDDLHMAPDTIESLKSSITIVIPRHTLLFDPIKLESPI